MHFQIGPPPEDQTITEQDGAWKLVQEPGTGKQQALAICTGLMLVAAIAMVVSLSIGTTPILNLSWPRIIVFIILVMPVHEFLHALAFQERLNSDNVVFGFYPKVFGFYAHYHGQIPRNRYLLIAGLPLVVLTILPLGVVVLFCLDCSVLIEIATANGVASAMDLLAIGIIIKQVPGRSVLINSGMKTYWKPTANAGNPGAG